MPTRFGAGFPKMPYAIGTPVTLEVMNKCLAEMEQLNGMEQLYLVEVLGGRQAWKSGRGITNVVLDGIRKHAGQIVDGLFKKLRK